MPAPDVCARGSVGSVTHETMGKLDQSFIEVNWSVLTSVDPGFKQRGHADFDLLDAIPLTTRLRILLILYHGHRERLSGSKSRQDPFPWRQSGAMPDYAEQLSQDPVGRR